MIIFPGFDDLKNLQKNIYFQFVQNENIYEIGNDGDTHILTVRKI